MNNAMNKKRARGGFSLLELILVLAVLGLLAGLGASAGRAVQRSTAVHETRGLFLELMTACQLYRVETGKWPPGLDAGGLELTPGSPEWKGALQPFMERTLAGVPLADGFGNTRLFIQVDLDGDRWIPGEQLTGLVPDQRPERVAGRLAVYSVDAEGNLGRGSWEDEGN